ncbi:DUF4105 domain-containing protein [Lysobacter panacisoli]|uniref:DUF4105 domain-containing protein n=1 Tax=Lysobacter panacisoli TaxID=1255263 RepID=A0ABP9LR65_9GAMM|nr:DUF4105 domain-containing protein [Lysobacter panacisoli]
MIHGRGLVRGVVLVVGLAFAAGSAQAALRLRLAEDGLTRAQVDASQRLLEEAQAHLPDAMRTGIDREIVVRWTDVLDDSIHGRATRDELLINRALLPPLTQAGAPPREALATVLHELAHFHDRAVRGALSRDPRLLDLAGWQVRATRFTTRVAGRQRENRFVDRSPDPYELTDAEEFVAVNVEHFLLDADYACRRPAVYRYLRDRLGEPRTPAASCDAQWPYVDAGESEGGAVGMLDPARVYAIDYLLAEGNSQPMSRWGHSMLRIVVCAPGRPRGPDCRLDLSHHRVLSFRAFVDDVQVSSWRGLSGRYPSRLFVLPMEQVIDEYTRVELRGLRSVPLRLDRGEIAAVLERAAQVHWSYDGRYYFLGNNCAAETWKLLHDSLPRLAGQGIGSITPTGLLQRLESAGVADASVLEDDDEALRLGYRFASQRAYFQQVYDVARTQLELPQRDVEDWLAMGPAQRRAWFEGADLRASAALLVLEQAAQRRQMRDVRDALKRRYLEQEAQSGVGDDPVRELLRESAYLGRPASLIEGGYGVPQTDERMALVARGDELHAKLQRTRIAVEQGARGWMSAQQRDTIDAIASNRDALGERLRALHAQEGGVRLDSR